MKRFRYGGEPSVGSLDQLLNYWKIDVCDVQGEFRYRVVATEQGNDRRGESVIILTSLPSD